MRNNIFILITIVSVIVILSIVYKSKTSVENFANINDNSMWNKLAGSTFCDKALDGTADHINSTFCQSSIKSNDFSNLSALIVNTPNEFTTKTIPYGQFKYGPSNINSSSYQFTYSLWIKVKNVRDYWRGIFRNGANNDGSRLPGLWIYPKALGVHFRISTSANGNEGLDIPAGNISLNKWVHVAYTLNDKTIKSFINGKLVQESQLQGSMIKIPEGSKLYLNNYNNAVGDIDIAKLRIFPIEVPEKFIKSVLVRETPDDNLDYQTCLLKQHGKTLENAHISCQSLLINKNIDVNSNGRNIQLKNSNTIENNKDYYNVYRIPSYRISNGICYLSGVILNSAVGEVAYIPDEARPDKPLIVFAGNTGETRLDITPKGIMKIVATNSDSMLSLDGISYSLKQSASLISYMVPRLTRYVKLASPMGMPLHISEIQVYDSTGVVVSQNKRVYQSSTYLDGHPERIVDGKIDGNWGNKNVNHTLNTSDANNPEHIEIDLERPYNVTRVDIYNRTDCCKERIVGSRLSLLDENKNVLVSQLWTEPNTGLDNKWKCIANIPVPLRKNNSGDVECMATDGRNCLWSGNMENCNKLLKSPPSNQNPLSCGLQHQRLYGDTGYTNPNHWCYRGKNYSEGASDTKSFSFGSQEGSMAKSIFSDYGGGHRGVNYTIINGVVYLSGVTISTSSISNKTTIGTLPKEAWPNAKKVIKALAIRDNGTAVVSNRIDIEVDGKVVAYPNKNKYRILSLDGASYNINTGNTSIIYSSGYSGYTPRILDDNEAIVKHSLYNSMSDKPIVIRNRPFPKNLTISMWLNTKQNGRQNPIAKGYGGDGTITIEPNGTISYYYGPNGGNSSPYTGLHTTNKIDYDRWTHIAISRDLTNKDIKIYINGIESDYSNEQPAGILDVSTSNEPLTIGSGYVNNYSGKIKDLKIFGRNLTDTEVYYLYSGQLSLDGVSQPSISKSNVELVSLQGILQLTNGTRANAGQVMEIPEDYRPNRQLKFMVNQGSKSALVEIDQYGKVLLQNNYPYIGYVSLDGIQYFTNK